MQTIFLHVLRPQAAPHSLLPAAAAMQQQRPIRPQQRAFGIWANRTTQIKRAEWMAEQYPNCPTEEPKQLPRRGRRGGWMEPENFLHMYFCF